MALGATIVLSACDENLTLSTRDIGENGVVQYAQVSNTFGGTGGNQSPRLAWKHAPAAAKSFVVTMYDPDAHTGSGFWHWNVLDLPASTKHLDSHAGAAGNVGLPAGALQGYTDYSTSAYGGPCPPVGDKPYHYIFMLYALSIPDVTAVVGPNPGGSLLGFVTLATATAKTSFTAIYGL
jgi:Raf kinase inhibitor-like YbhB/YbcL family protein